MKKKILAGGNTPCGTKLSTHLRIIATLVVGLSPLACDMPSSTPSDSATEHRSDAAASLRLSAPPVSIPADRRVTLTRALAFAEANAPPILVAHSELELGEAEMVAASQTQPFNPTLSLGLGQRRQGAGVGLDAQVAVQQQLEVAGQRRRRRESARLFAELKALGLDVVTWSVHAEVHWAFERALLAEERLALAQERVSVSEDLLRMAERRVELGDESSVALEVARAEVAVAHSAAIGAGAEVSTSRIRLAAATGAEVAALTPVGTLDPPVITRDGPELAKEAIEVNPTLRAADAETHVAEADLAVARREAWPSPTVGVSFAREGSTSTPNNPNPASTIWMGTLQIPIPAFARNQGSVARNRARVRVAQARHKAAAMQFNSMLSTAAARVDAAAVRIRALETGAVVAFERSLASLRRAYDMGELSFLEVAAGLDRLWRAREQSLDAKASYYDAFAELERLVGPLDATSDSHRPSLKGDDG